MKKAEQPKELRFEIRLTAEDKNTIQAKAKRAGLSLSDYMRRAALRQKIEERLPTDMRRHVTSVGSNLARLTRLAQAGKLDQMDLAQLNTIVQTLTKALQ